MSVAACPGCAAGGVPEAAPALVDGRPTQELVLPTIHCLSCIRTVEKVLNAQPGIASARVNLSRKRAAIVADPDADPGPWIDALASAGFEAHEADGTGRAADDSGLALRLGIAGFAMMNVMLLSVAVWAGASDATRDFFHWVSALIALPAALFAAEPFFAGAWRALSARRLNMDVPIALAILLASGMSLYETMTGGAHAYFDAALSLTFFLLAGRFLESRMRRAARSAAADLAALEPSRVTVLTDGRKESRLLSDVVIGDHLWLAAGGRVPVDADLISGEVAVDRSALTGESDPVTLSAGETLAAGDVILAGPVTVVARETSGNSTLRRMIDLASIAEGARSRYTGLADRAAALYAPLVHTLSFAAFVAWAYATGNFHLAMNIAISTLIITCPCALGLAVPAVATVATGRLFRKGALVKSETALERLAEVDTVIFDKTGTLTRSALIPPGNLRDADRAVLRALAEASDHPLSRSLLSALEDVEPAPLSEIREHRGQGVVARHEGRTVRLGSGTWIGAGQTGGTLFDSGHGLFPLDRYEQPEPGARDLIDRLTGMGLSVHLLTGDKQDHAGRIGAELGLKSVHAGMDPAGKQAYVRALQAEGRKVVMVGDGLNDTLALTEAWASVAPGTALEASQSAADIVLLRGHLGQLAEAIVTARSARRRVLENFGLAAVYNAVAVPLALAGLATPLLAALAMSTSSILVTLNALRTR